MDTRGQSIDQPKLKHFCSEAVVMNKRVLWVCRLGLVAVLMGAASFADTGVRTNAADALANTEVLVWPKPPEQERVRYLRSVTGPADWGIARSWMRRLVDTLTGRSEEVFMRPS